MKTKIEEVIAGSELIAQALIQKRQNKIREGINIEAIRLDTVNGISSYTDFPQEAPTSDLVFRDKQWKEEIERLDKKINEVNSIPSILNNIVGDF